MKESNSPADIVARQVVRDAVEKISPYDHIETEHQTDVLNWIDSGAPLFRIEKPDKPAKHLVSYFVLYDEVRRSLMLIDHLKAKLWLPTGGHIDPNEDPRTTVIREAKEELDINASFETPFGQDPLFVTVTKTRGHGEHTDVSLWYIIAGDSSIDLWYDTNEMAGYKWLSFEEILAMDIAVLDPHMHRFVGKMRQRETK